MVGNFFHLQIFSLLGSSVEFIFSSSFCWGAVLLLLNTLHGCRFRFQNIRLFSPVSGVYFFRICTFTCFIKLTGDFLHISHISAIWCSNHCYDQFVGCISCFSMLLLWFYNLNNNFNISIEILSPTASSHVHNLFVELFSRCTKSRVLPFIIDTIICILQRANSFFISFK